ncbi:uncharacterized protein IL334_007863 [Kwoniella shivajii]|uniref:Uncharacterized protein n=1 Tax=Kwoniella shivajii TaxID=564305 RepID=A0ABZ1DC41_9TREE|nr:hypothetical protein IL334_007863 [Kwoniella shivajii]
MLTSLTDQKDSLSISRPWCSNSENPTELHVAVRATDFRKANTLSISGDSGNWTISFTKEDLTCQWPGFRRAVNKKLDQAGAKDFSISEFLISEDPRKQSSFKPRLIAPITDRPSEADKAQVRCLLDPSFQPAWEEEDPKGCGSSFEITTPQTETESKDMTYTPENKNAVFGYSPYPGYEIGSRNIEETLAAYSPTGNANLIPQHSDRTNSLAISDLTYLENTLDMATSDEEESPPGRTKATKSSREG